MVGFVGSIVAFFALTVPAWTREIERDLGSPWQVLLLAGAVTVGALLLGIILTRTVGIAAVGLSIGGLAAAVICVFTGQWAYVLPMLAHALGGWLIQTVLAAGMGIGGSRVGPIGN